MIPAFSLAATPPANAFVPAARVGTPQPCFPLEVYFCQGCTHLQLRDVVDPRALFEDYVYASGTSPVFVRHFVDYADAIWSYARAQGGDLVVDIGSNDGTLLQCFLKLGARVAGIDPARAIALEATRRGIDTLPQFFSPALAAALRAERGPAKIVTANNVCAHIDDLTAVLDGVAALLGPGGVFVFEVSYLADVIRKTLFDTIYHEHLDYHAVRPLLPFLRSRGFELVEAIRVDPHGGSVRAIARRAADAPVAGESVALALAEEQSLGLDRVETYAEFSQRIERLGTQLGQLLRRLKAQDKRIACFGAPAKATTLMYHFGIGPDIVDFIVDDSPLKQGLFSPGMHIPVLPAAAIAERRPDYLLILAWNFAGAIVEKHSAFRGQGGRFIVPLPFLEVI